VSAWRLAMQVGLPDVAAQLRAAGVDETLTVEEDFVSACARADAAAARRIQARHPELPRLCWRTGYGHCQTPSHGDRALRSR
jgi:hypothetical protein